MGALADYDLILEKLTTESSQKWNRKDSKLYGERERETITTPSLS